MWNIQLFKLNFDHKEVEAVADVVSGGWLSMGEKIIEFENEFNEYLSDGVMCSAVSNGTASLHMALLALGVKPGDEVIIPALTFVADANTVALVGATPVLADSTSMDDWNISLESIEEKITTKTKAIIIVHYAGYPCKDIKAISEFCKAKNIGLIEDTAHAPGASIANKKCGTWGDVGSFSFFSNKNLSIGEGGMVSTTDKSIHEKLRHLRSHGMTSLTLDRHKGRAISYDVILPGLNYRMDEMRAALGLVQLKKLDEGNLKREYLTNRYRKNFESSPIKIPFMMQPDDSVSAYHILPALLPDKCDRLEVINALKEKKIQTSIHYPPFWGFKAYEHLFSIEDAPITSQICSRELTLPLFPSMTEEEVDEVSNALLQVI
jgi:dTDP-4-amino-4,6-dideoxygalactose transaminase